MSTEKTCNECKSNRLHSRGLVNRLGSTYRRYICKDCNTNNYYLETKENKKQPIERFRLSVEAKEHVENSYERYVITSIQNNSVTHNGFKESLLNYCFDKNAHLLIIPVRYRNPDSFHSGVQEGYLWDESLISHFVESEVSIGNNVKVLGNYYANATTPSPINGLEKVAKGKTIIIGHGTLQMKTVPVLSDETPVIITSTGSMSIQNYSESRAGFHSFSNHTIGAVVVEIDRDNGIFHLRHLIADSEGSFYDVDGFYTPEGRKPLERISGLVTGDEHAWFVDKNVLKATYHNKDSIVNSLRPKYIVRHDIFDGFSINHHHDNSFFKQFKKLVDGKNDVEQELLDTAGFVIETMEPNDSTHIIVSSNHNSFLMKWLENPKAAFDLYNATIYTELRERVLGALRSGDDPEPFNLWLTEYLKGWPDLEDRLFFTDRNNSYKIQGVEVSMHGDKGANGAKGSKNSFSKMSTPVIVGHSHSPCIEGKCFQVGTSSELQLDYNQGLSSWLHTHALIYPNGQVQLINIIRGRWKL